MKYSASIVVLFSTFCNVTADGVIKAGGNTRRILIIDLLCSWLVAIPLGALCAFVFNWPAYILYVMLRSNNFLKSIWAIQRLNKRDWIIEL